MHRHCSALAQCSIDQDSLTRVGQPIRLASSVKISNSNLRKEAYRYILERLSKLPIDFHNADRSLSIPLSELRLLKEGISDPSAALVASLKQLLKGMVTEAEIDAYLVTPFEQHE